MCCHDPRRGTLVGIYRYLTGREKLPYLLVELSMHTVDSALYLQRDASTHLIPGVVLHIPLPLFVGVPGHLRCQQQVQVPLDHHDTSS